MPGGLFGVGFEGGLGGVGTVGSGALVVGD